MWEALPALGWEVRPYGVPQGDLRGDGRARPAVGSRPVIDGRPRPSAATRVLLRLADRLSLAWGAPEQRVRIESAPHRVAVGISWRGRSRATAPPVYGQHRP